MKIILLICIVSFWLTAETNAQLNDKSKSTKKVDADYLLKKSKRQKIRGFFFLGVGSGLLYLGNNMASKGTFNQIGSGLALMVAGGGLVIASIPTLISSGKNKRRASFLLTNETISYRPQLYVKKNFASIKLKIDL